MRLAPCLFFFFLLSDSCVGLASPLFAALLYSSIIPRAWSRLQRSGARDTPAGDVMLRVLPRHVPPPEGVPHVHHRRDAPHAGALYQLRDAAALAKGVPWYVFFLFIFLFWCLVFYGSRSPHLVVLACPVLSYLVLPRLVLSFFYVA